MDAATIDLLSRHLPGANHPSLLEAGAMEREGQFEAIDNFVDKYSNLAFGWHAAREFAKAKRMFPLAMLGSDKWVFRAYMFQLDPHKYYDATVAEAFALSHSILEGVGRGVKALLTVEGITLQDVSDKTSIRKEVVEAFSTLFYNVIDRRSDQMYMSQVVYPDTRFVTLRQGYFDHASISDLLIRSGYESKSADAVSYMAGLTGGDYLRGIAARGESVEQLEGSMMANAVNLAVVGLVNQKLLGLTQSKTLMVADKQGGNQQAAAPVLQIASIIKGSLLEANIVNNANIKTSLRASEELNAAIDV